MDPAQIIVTGATQLRQVFSPEDVPGILVAYMDGLKIAFAIGVAGAGASFIVSLASRWHRLNVQAVKETGGAA